MQIKFLTIFQLEYGRNMSGRSVLMTNDFCNSFFKVRGSYVNRTLYWEVNFLSPIYFYDKEILIKINILITITGYGYIGRYFLLDYRLYKSIHHTFWSRRCSNILFKITCTKIPCTFSGGYNFTKYMDHDFYSGSFGNNVSIICLIKYRKVKNNIILIRLLVPSYY